MDLGCRRDQRVARSFVEELVEGDVGGHQGPNIHCSDGAAAHRHEPPGLV